MLDPNGPSRKRFLDAAFSRPTDRPPVWLMRQAGRYLPEYRQVRSGFSFLGLCENVENAVEVSLQPFRRFGMDGVILFSDILIPLRPMGLEVVLDDGGPRLPRPIRSAADVAALRGFDPSKETAFVPAILQTLKRELDGEAALIGFSGAPWTLATYAVEGGASRSFTALKTMMHTEPRLLDDLLGRLADSCGDYLAAQIEAGADVVQVFDTWAGELSRADYERFARPATERLLARLPRRGEVPVILYCSGSAHLLASMAETSADVLSVDWKLPLDQARTDASGKALQGNVDPGVLLGNAAGVTSRVLDARRAAGPTGHIVNLGHGVLPPTPPGNVAAFVNAARLPLGTA
jgi:uroporphyrinogen decarboxylase